MRNLHLGRGCMEKKSCVFIDKRLRREWVGIVPHSIIQTTVSLRESFRFQTTPAGFGFGQICQAFSPLAAKHRIIHCLLAHFLPHFPFPISLLQWNEATDRQMGRWGSTVFPRPKTNWERLEKDSALLNSPDMMGKSMHTSSVFASCWSERPQPNVVSAGSH